MATPDSDIRQRSERLSKLYDLTALRNRTINLQTIQQYYRSSSLGYRWFHSREGSIHMGLTQAGSSPSPANYRRQMELLLDHLDQDGGAGVIVDLGCGRGYNLGVLAPLLPNYELVGIDIAAGHVRSARRSLSNEHNVAILRGDFADTGLNRASCDVLFSVESLCHASDLHALFLELRRIARPGAKLVVFDAWRTEACRDADSDAELALTALERAMSVGSVSTVQEWLRVAAIYGWKCEDRLDLREEVLPSLERLERLATRFLRHEHIAKAARRLWSGPLLENVIAGYLMAEAVRSGFHTYEMITLAASTKERRRAGTPS